MPESIKLTYLPRLVCRVASLVIAALVLSGCTATYTRHLVGTGLQHMHLKDQQAVLRSNVWRLPLNTRLFLARPQFPHVLDDKHTSMPRARTALHQALEQALRHDFPNLSIAKVDLNQQEALLAARLNGAQVALIPQLFEYTNAKNTWREYSESASLPEQARFGRDTAVFQIVVLDVVTGAHIDTVTATANQRLFASASQAAEIYQKASVRYAQMLSGREP
ncbi:DUF4823 domain-containing protein [Teredinibacter turnerae]|uniref:DUF4823 domain-containing protein n=1 Tax=Teredinibacter turnerae TaxID=2426 RepID=UPI0005F7E0CB|nr:DUF4823 domain-containing protein [Teredinibacter turnerae]